MVESMKRSDEVKSRKPRGKSRKCSVLISLRKLVPGADVGVEEKAAACVGGRQQ